MAITWIYENNIVEFSVSGTLTKQEMDKSQLEAESIIQENDASLLVLLSDFHGWDKPESDDWEDISFAERNDPYIYKLAIVGTEEWREIAGLFVFKDLRNVEIEYFLPEQEMNARQWLSE